MTTSTVGQRLFAADTPRLQPIHTQKPQYVSLPERRSLELTALRGRRPADGRRTVFRRERRWDPGYGRLGTRSRRGSQV